MLNTLSEEIKSMRDILESVKSEINLDELIEALLELHNLVELDSVKQMIAVQVRAFFFSIIAGRRISQNFHTILCGPSGVGKSTVARCLAKIFKAMGLTKMKSNSSKISIDSVKKQLCELYEYHNQGKPIPNNIVKTFWRNIKDYIDENPVETSDDSIITCGRDSLIAPYSGQTSLKAIEFFKANIGKCIIIEEAYLLYTGENDGYGMEALTELNMFMETYMSEVIIMMTGYRDLIETTLFKAQPGLKRRFQWIFELEGYSPDGLRQMFEKQMLEDGWVISSDIDLNKFFTDNYNYFPHYGGDTRRLAWICKAVHSDAELNTLLSVIRQGGSVPIPLLSQNNLDKAFINYKTISMSSS